MRANGRHPRGAGLARSALILLSLAALVAALPLAWRLHETHALWGELMLAPVARLAADRVVVLKARRELLLYHDDTVVKRYPVSLGFEPNGHKRREGDGRTPEGRYRLDWRRLSERVGAAIHVSYPNARDRERAARDGVDPGGGIMLHALAGDLPWSTAAPDRRVWTAGCIGLAPADMHELWYAVADGTPIDIRP
jgi:murein L,D-transpeptidase YafK